VERLLALWVPEYAEEKADGASLRTMAALLDALVSVCPFVEPIRLGLLTLPLRGPSRFFGGDEAVFEVVRATVHDVAGVTPQLGVAEGLFCADLAARQGVVVPAGEGPAFRRAQSIEVLGRRDLMTTCRRLGIHTVGAFADLPPARVAERFSAPVRVLHRVARGDLQEMPGQRDAKLPERLRRSRGEEVHADEQMGFFGQRSAGDDRAQAAAHRLRHRLGVESVLVAEVLGGRTPDDRATLVPWGAPRATSRDQAPWPGRIGAPAPTTSFRQPVAVDVVSETGERLELSARGTLSAAPGAVVLRAGTRHRVRWSAGPWPMVERWWQTPRRRAHLQVLLDTGEAFLLMTEAGRWWLTGVYD